MNSIDKFFKEVYDDYYKNDKENSFFDKTIDNISAIRPNESSNMNNEGFDSNDDNNKNTVVDLFTSSGSLKIKFPFKPYTNQLNYMKEVIKLLNLKNEKRYGILESPTGTGKTLCLLCSCLEFTATLGIGAPKIFYSTRTHKQIKNVIQQLKKTIYKPRIATLSSRDNSCVYQEIMNHKSLSLNYRCKELIKNNQEEDRIIAEDVQNSLNQTRLRKKKCPFYSRTSFVEDKGIIDLEELCSIGLREKFCPYFYEQNREKKADLVFLPYSYFFSPELKKGIDLNLKNSIIIFDEGHNILRVCEECASASINLIQLNEIQKNLEELKKKKKIKDVFESCLNTLSKFVEMLMFQFLSFVEKCETDTGDNLKGLVLSLTEFLSIFINCVNEINKSSSTSVKEVIIQIIYYITSLEDLETEVTLELISLHNVMRIVKKVLKSQANNFEKFKEDFKFYISEKEDQTKSKVYTLDIFCLNPAFSFNKILKKNPYAVIITSGTLSPLSTFEQELKIDFPIKLENSHNISTDQVFFRSISKSRKVNFLFDYNHRNDKEMIIELGDTILKISNVTPGGVLVFFTSYLYMNYCYDVWKKERILEKFRKKIYKETPKIDKETIDDFKRYNGIFFSVFRGNNSEGLNFCDDQARLAILVGIPYANLKNPQIKLKQEYMAINFQNGKEWYMQEAIRVVNQSLGRVIRHKDDYGAVIVIDQRYEQRKVLDLFSKWLKNCIKSCNANEEFINELKEFFCKWEKKEKRRQKIYSNKNNIFGNNNISSIIEDNSISFDSSISSYQNDKSNISKDSNKENRSLIKLKSHLKTLLENKK